MGTGGRGNLVHLDNTYVKTVTVKDNVNILLGDYCIIEDNAGVAEVRPLVAADFSADDTFLDLSLLSLVISGEDANNLTTTDALLRKNQVECLFKGTDWTLNMAASVIPNSSIGILRVDAASEPFQAASKTGGAIPVAQIEKLGLYQHKEFSTVANVSLLDDDGIVTTTGFN